MLILALDVNSLEDATSIIERTQASVDVFKIGHQLHTAAGPEAIRHLKSKGLSVFLDLKLHEIPNSVAQAVHAAGRLGVNYVTVHASGGTNMMKAAVAAASEYSNLRILALTVVTGLTDEDLVEIGFRNSTEEQAVKLAKLAEAAGCHGVVCSVSELPSITSNIGTQFLKFTPGIRWFNNEQDDQSRVATPNSAGTLGASALIVGRPIIKAKDPEKAARAIKSEFNEGCRTANKAYKKRGN